MKKLETFLIPKTYVEGEYLIREGEFGDAIFIVEKGKVEARKDGIKLGEQAAGDYVGAMALMENTTRSASVLALEETKVKVLTINQLRALESDDIYQQVLTNHIKSQQKLVRKLTNSTINETKSKLKEAETKVQLANFFYYLILILVSYKYILGIYIENHDFLRQGFYRGIVTPSVVLLIVLFGYGVARQIGIPLSYLGWKFDNWRAHLKEALLWTFAFLVAATILKWILIQVLPSYAERQVFESFILDDSLTPTLLIIFNLVYAIMTPMQEFIARGILQGSLTRMLTGKYVTFKSILLSNLVFSALHLHIDLRFALITIIPGFFWGYLYDRQQSILGVSVSHLIIGMFFFLVLGQF
ncbi:MAG: cyclic nucleotide-binding domain-containing protein [Bacteroidota bacterium]